jgi:hypothetical protein
MRTPEVDQLSIAIQNVRQVMECGRARKDFERLSLENYVALLQ